eukprot:1257046-Amphidinium_carterae.1
MREAGRYIVALWNLDFDEARHEAENASETTRGTGQKQVYAQQTTWRPKDLEFELTALCQRVLRCGWEWQC